MGILDNLKNVLGGKKDQTIAGATKAPSQVLKENGIDPSKLKFAFAADGTVTVSGQLARAEDEARIKDLLLGIPGIKKVVQDVSLATDAVPAAGVASATASTTTADEEAAPGVSGTVTREDPAAAKTYTVEAGDTLWKIARHFYGDGDQYLKIFEANKGLLKDPDHIFPGQELVIPEINA